MKRIGIIGVPLEEAMTTAGDHIAIDIQGMTDQVRHEIIEGAKKMGIRIEDLGETDVGAVEAPQVFIDRRADILPEVASAFRKEIYDRTICSIKPGRIRVLALAKEFDLLIATGPSHAGAVVLYESGDRVARLDYHTDYNDMNPGFLDGNSYMDSVKAMLGESVFITNYFVKWGTLAGKWSGGNMQPNGMDYQRANHFDIDVDCFNEILEIQTIYKHEFGPPKATPEMVIGMIREARPKKLGIWEYRLYDDARRNGMDFIVNAIGAAVL